MRRVFKSFAWLALVFGLVVALLFIFNYDYLIKAVRTIYFTGHKTAFLDDYKYFENRTIEKGVAQPWPFSRNYNKTRLTPKLVKLHQDIGTVAFLIIKNDSIWHESYYDGYDKDSKSNSFSMAKSVVSAALGKAIKEGKIKSLDQKVGDFFPEFKKGKAAMMTVGDLSSMASGLNWDENYYSPFSVTTRAYFDPDLTACMLGTTCSEDAGQRYKYLSGNTQLLAMVLEKATGRSLADYVSDKFWKPMGAENDALWQTDRKDGIVKAYCCIASNARDFARFGKLYKQYGKWNGRQLLDSTFVAKSINPRFADSPQYGYGWWLAELNGKKVYYMRGHLGQYTIVIPQDDLIVVRLGHKYIRSTKGNPHSDDFWVILEEVDKMIR
jgi:CubicO group peptidase (beta-lactamase class C family)